MSALRAAIARQFRAISPILAWVQVAFWTAEPVAQDIPIAPCHPPALDRDPDLGINQRI
ncbi:hypothetical protein [Alkalinema sp. FACHB-956]|uniref:hypothetical protein n=1 Tax=Alkalinema sp. FACHB-956 TaxID=2692768 RepID=UPI001681C99B|nr:hypothetical protein [Alkalinema sp. FACHB-956]MBD2325744.1 hypothetical protein [Alkalinema sp. FACHB-956]